MLILAIMYKNRKYIVCGRKVVCYIHLTGKNDILLLAEDTTIVTGDKLSWLGVQSNRPGSRG